MANGAKYDVGVLGVWSGCNYGSVLTYYGLHEALKSLGYSVLMVSKINASADDPEWADTHSLRFAREHYDISKNYSVQKLSELNALCDTFIVGSDQLWNYGISKNFGKAYYLDFADEGKRKIAYATSFGHAADFAPPEERGIISRCMKRFHAISVREKDGVRLCRDIYGVKATQVVDPVLLCGKSLYESLAEKSSLSEAGPYVLTYILDPTSEKRTAMLYISERLGLKLVNIVDGLPWNFEKNKSALNLGGAVPNVQSEDFVHLYRNAQFVATDSFHGTVFALLFNKPFVSMGNRHRGMSRFNSLFGIIGNKDRFTLNPETIAGNEKLFEAIDYAKINAILEAERAKSFDWLKNALETPLPPSSNLTDTGGPPAVKAAPPAQETAAHRSNVSIVPAGSCTGCGACANACPFSALALKPDDLGYYRPALDKGRCAGCGKCAGICPALKLPQNGNSNRPTLLAFAASDERVLESSSSGGPSRCSRSRHSQKTASWRARRGGTISLSRTP
jgi:ferredoxin